MRKCLQKVLGIIRQDAKISTLKISKEVNMPKSTVFDRLKYLERNYIKRYVMLVDFPKIGFTGRAFILLKTGKKDRKNIEMFLSHHKNINRLCKINDGFDFFIDVVFRNISNVDEFIEKIESKYCVKKKKVIYIINELKREEFLCGGKNCIFQLKNQKD